MLIVVLSLVLFWLVISLSVCFVVLFSSCCFVVCCMVVVCLFIYVLVLVCLFLIVGEITKRIVHTCGSISSKVNLFVLTNTFTFILLLASFLCCERNKRIAGWMGK